MSTLPVGRFLIKNPAVRLHDAPVWSPAALSEVECSPRFLVFWISPSKVLEGQGRSRLKRWMVFVRTVQARGILWLGWLALLSRDSAPAACMSGMLGFTPACDPARIAALSTPLSLGVYVPISVESLWFRNLRAFPLISYQQSTFFLVNFARNDESSYVVGTHSLGEEWILSHSYEGESSCVLIQILWIGLKVHFDLNEGFLFLLKLAYFLCVSYINTHISDIYIYIVYIWIYIHTYI